VRDLRECKHLGRTPLKSEPLPREGYYRFRVVKEGFETAELAGQPVAGATARITLHSKAETPSEMVWIPAVPSAVFGQLLGVELPPAQVPAAWLDRYEVTNRQFKQFLDTGGYRHREYWKHPFYKDGREISWEEAMVLPRDFRSDPFIGIWYARVDSNHRITWPQPIFLRLRKNPVGRI